MPAGGHPRRKGASLLEDPPAFEASLKGARGGRAPGSSGELHFKGPAWPAFHMEELENFVPFIFHREILNGKGIQAMWVPIQQEPR